MSDDKPFWETKTLEQMNQAEWESLCDDCGQCCIVRIEDELTAEVYETNVICGHYDCAKRHCSRYTERTGLSDGCVQLTPALVEQFDWLPASCAYRRHQQGLPLLPSHPLLAGNSTAIRNVAESAAENALDSAGDHIAVVNVVDRYAPLGLIQNGPDVLPEQHLVFPDEFE